MVDQKKLKYLLRCRKRAGADQEGCGVRSGIDVLANLSSAEM